MKIGGFDPIYRNAGDDVDVCWRIQDAGYTIGFHPSALVWHHRRNSLRAYWKQQKGYGKAEALLESKWPEKYNGFGHLTWEGRIYGNGLTIPVKFKKDKIFHGTWGSALFQSVYQSGGFINSIPLMPEWYFLSALFAIIGLLGFIWWPLLFAWLPFAVSVFMVVMQAAISASRNSTLQPHQKKNFKYKSLIIALHVIQPVARLYGRLKHGLTPWRKRGMDFDSLVLFVFGKHIFSYWSEKWRSSEEWLTLIEKDLMNNKTRVKRGKEFDNWDLEVRTGLFSSSHGVLAVEDHGSGKQFLRFRCQTFYNLHGYMLCATLCGLAVLAAMSGELWVGGIFWLMFSIAVYRYLIETAQCLNSLYLAFQSVSNVDEYSMSPKVIPLKTKPLVKERAREYEQQEEAMQDGLVAEVNMESNRE